MRIMNGDMVVAVPIKAPNGMQIGFRVVPEASFIDAPVPLFGLDKHDATMEAFFDWLRLRCFPPERVDAADLLKQLGLSRYDHIEICRITKARLPGIDEFWVDWDR